MFAFPGALIVGVVGIVRDNNKIAAIIAAVVAGVVVATAAIAIGGVVWG